MVIADGLKPGEVIALADPYAKKASKKNECEKGRTAMPGMPAAAAEESKMAMLPVYFPNWPWGFRASWRTSCAACSPCSA